MAKKQEIEGKPTQAEGAEFDMLYPILESVYDEFKELSKKKQDGLLNLLKAKMVNRILSKVKKILRQDSSIEFLDLLDEELLPSNSDTTIILAQYKSAMEQFKDKHYGYSRVKNEHTWFTKD